MVDYTAEFLHVITRAPSSSVAIIGTTTRKQNTGAVVNSVLWTTVTIIFIETRISFLGNLMMFSCYSFISACWGGVGG
jgi:hypothetical protein